MLLDTAAACTHSRTLSTLAATILLAGTAAGNAAAQTSSSYSVSHNFSFAPAGDVVEVKGYYFEHAWVARNGVRDEDHFPAAQDPAFDPYGTEAFLGAGIPENSGLFGFSVPVQYHSFLVPAAGLGPASSCVTVINPPYATACVSYQVDPFVVTPGAILIDGTIGSNGTADPQLVGRGAAIAYAFSTSAIVVRGGTQLANGWVQWNPSFSVDSVGAGTSASQVHDPIDYTVTDLATGAVSSFTLLEIDADVEGQGSFKWDAGLIEYHAPEIHLTASIPAALVGPGQGGKLDVLVENGVVTQSVGTGVFAGIAPPLGAAVPFDTPAPPLALNYDLGLDPAIPHDVQVTFSGGGGTQTEATNTCVADMNGDGVIDNGDIGTFITLFLEGHPAADLTGDGVVDNADIGAFIEVFLAGCPDAD